MSQEDKKQSGHLLFCGYIHFLNIDFWPGLGFYIIILAWN